MRTLEDHLFGKGPKRILALDGGGIRGVITLEILKEIENIVGSPLSEYFDLIGGTSTGSIIAAGLARGWEVDRLIGLYEELGQSIFQKSLLRWGLLRAKFSAQPLRKALQERFGDIELGDQEQIKTGLAIVAKRIDTHSPWVLHNNPKGKYYGPREGSTSKPNKELLVRHLVRASTAAPHFFDPEPIQVTRDLTGTFVDGGMSPHNNPALQLLMLATLKGHRLHWELGPNKLLLVSVGTGTWAQNLSPQEAEDKIAVGNAFGSLLSMMDDASALNEQLLQWMSTSPTARTIDREVGDLGDDLFGGQPWLSYVRYDAPLERDWLEEQLPHRELTDDQITKLQKMDRSQSIGLLSEVGQAAAKQQVRAEHFPAAFAVNN